VLDIEHERDIERLRRLALLQKSQLEHLVAVLARKCAELAKLKGGEDELQLTLKLLEDAQKQVAEADALTGRGRGGGDSEKKDREPQTGHGPTEQAALEQVSLLCELDEADRVCPSCSGHLEPLKGQAERSGDDRRGRAQVTRSSRWSRRSTCASAALLWKQRLAPSAPSTAGGIRCASRSRWPTTSTWRTSRWNARRG
jgi:hypothetical protein